LAVSTSFAWISSVPVRSSRWTSEVGVSCEAALSLIALNADEMDGLRGDAVAFGTQEE
jgi:hypothetical protein